MTQKNSKWVNLVWVTIIAAYAAVIGYGFYRDAMEHPERYSRQEVKQVEEGDYLSDPGEPLFWLIW